MSWVKPKERRYILRWYSSPDITNDEIASDLGMSMTEFFEACVEIGLRPREEPDIYVPSQEEIARVAAEIRLGWDSETAESRMRVSRGSEDLGCDVDCGHEEEGFDL